MKKLYLDMDGVLADFDRGYKIEFGLYPQDEPDGKSDWERVRSTENFFKCLPPMPDARELWKYTSWVNPTILTAVPKDVPEASDNKKTWVKHYLGPKVPVITCLASEKCLYADDKSILVDDNRKYHHLWVKAKGIWITHLNAEITIKELMLMGMR